MRYHLFIIGKPYTDEWWARHISMGVITAGFDNAVGDPGYNFLHNMDEDDWVIAYAPGYGAVGAGTVGREETYRRLGTRELPADFESPHRQFRSVTSAHYVETLNHALPPSELRLGFPPRHTKTEFRDRKKACRIIRLLASKSDGEPRPPVHEAVNLEEPPGRVKATTYRILRDTVKSRGVKRLHEYKCQSAGSH